MGGLDAEMTDPERASSGERFGMAVLVNKTGVPPATIRHYLALGLLPDPYCAASNRFLYDRRHVEALQLIRFLRERRHLPLGEIAELLPDLLGSDQDHAFRPEMWERAVEDYLGRHCQPSAASALVEVATEAFTRTSYAEVTVDDICAHAGLAKGSFYRYFTSKEELFFAAAEAVGEELVRSLDQLRGSRDEETAAAGLTAALRARLPLVLELVARMAQRRPGYVRVGRQVLARVAEAAAKPLGGRRQDLEAGRRVVERALGAAVGQVTAGSMSN